MNKAILVIDMPSCCKDCPLCVSEELFPSFYEYRCVVENTDVDVYDKPDWCPLKPAPEYCIYFGGDDDYADGYNDCLSDIIGD